MTKEKKKPKTPSKTTSNTETKKKENKKTSKEKQQPTVNTSTQTIPESNIRPTTTQDQDTVQQQNKDTQDQTMTAMATMKPFCSTTDDPDIWISKCTRFTEVQGWNNDKAIQNFPLYLDNTAYLWFDHLPKDKKNTTDRIKCQFLDRFQPTEGLRCLQVQEFQDKKIHGNFLT